MSTEKVLYKGTAVQCFLNEDHFAEICFNNESASVNKFDLLTLSDLEKAVGALKKETRVKGCLFTSKKDVFIVGADITEFLPRFKVSDEEMTKWLTQTHEVFNSIEDLPYPTVALINGVCLGGGFELALTTSFRLATPQASVGLPETKLGIYPGWGGTIRLPRMIGTDNAIEWICMGGTYKPQDALNFGAIDAIVEEKNARKAGFEMLSRAALGKLDWTLPRKRKMSPLTFLSDIESTLVFEGSKAFVAGQVGTNYPAPLEAISTMQKTAKLERKDAASIEIKGFVKLAKSAVAENLITIFLADQFNKKKTKNLSQNAAPNLKSAVLGAGIMGGGIAYQSASKGVPILMKDITTKALDLGLSEAIKLLGKQVERKKITIEGMAKVLTAIMPTLSYSDFANVDLVVEAVVENEAVKKSVLADVEKNAKPGTILASNTSTISITRLAESLAHPENFCGMHFFNPVHKMPLVEIIRGKKTSDKAIASVVGYALKMGKLPIVVNDCAGFLVNRILFPYFYGLTKLVEDGVDFVRIDKVMEKFGWPMGPAYLLDVIGLDTGVHAGAVMAASFPERMGFDEKSVMNVLVAKGRFGQKNGKGFYAYVPDKKGASKKTPDPDVAAILQTVAQHRVEVSDEAIVERMMIPMINEAARCLEEKIVETSMEADLALLNGLGFPPFRGGVLKYADSLGLGTLCERAKTYEHLGRCYEAAPMIRTLAQSKQKFYS